MDSSAVRLASASSSLTRRLGSTALMWSTRMRLSALASAGVPHWLATGRYSGLQDPIARLSRRARWLWIIEINGMPGKQSAHYTCRPVPFGQAKRQEASHSGLLFMLAASLLCLLSLHSYAWDVRSGAGLMVCDV